MWASTSEYSFFFGRVSIKLKIKDFKYDLWPPSKIYHNRKCSEQLAPDNSFTHWVLHSKKPEEISRIHVWNWSWSHPICWEASIFNKFQSFYFEKLSLGTLPRWASLRSWYTRETCKAKLQNFCVHVDSRRCTFSCWSKQTNTIMKALASRERERDRKLISCCIMFLSLYFTILSFFPPYYKQ